MPRLKSQDRSISQRRPHRKITYDQKLAFVSKRERVPDPYNRRAVVKRYKALKSFPLDLQKPATKAQRTGLKKRGFFTTGKGVIVDGPRDAKRKPVKSRRFKVLANGDGVKWTVNGRRDYIIGLTDAERSEFAVDPGGFIKRHRAMMRSKYRDFRNARDVQTRLQWGAYQATKDFNENYFTRRYPYIDSPVKGKKVLDRLTGIHYVIHLPRKHRAKRKKK